MVLKRLGYAAIPVLLVSMNTQAVTVDQVNRQVQKLNQRMAAQDQRFKVNGYASFALTKSDEAMAYNGVSEDISYNRFTKAGLQMSFKVNPTSSVITQMVARGSDNFNVNMEWAYFQHAFSDNVSAKFGRIRGPYYMLSEYLDVGYAVPWAQMPAETYSLLNTFANMDGASLAWSTDIGWDTLQIEAFVGRTEDDNFILNDAVGLSATYTGETWSVRLSTAAAGLRFGQGSEGQALLGAQSLLDGSAPLTQAGAFSSIGFRYEPGDFLIMGEYTTSTVESITQDQDSAFISVGYRIGQWTPHISFGMHESTDDDERNYPADLITLADTLAGGAGLGNPDTVTVGQALTAGAGGDPTFGGNPALDPDPTPLGQVAALVRASSQSDATRIGIGARYDWSPGVAIKVQYDMIKADQAGLFDPSSYAAAGAGAPDSTNIMTISIDTVF